MSEPFLVMEIRTREFELTPMLTIRRAPYLEIDGKGKDNPQREINIHIDNPSGTDLDIRPGDEIKINHKKEKI